MNSSGPSRRDFLRTSGFAAGACLFSAHFPQHAAAVAPPAPGNSLGDYTLRIKASALEIAPKRVASSEREVSPRR